MMSPQTLKGGQTITLEETGQTPTEPAKTPIRITRGFRKPSHKTATAIFWITFAVVAVVAGIGIVVQDMRFVMAAIYFAVGFVFQRAGFCSASLLSAAVLSRDMRGLRHSWMDHHISRKDQCHTGCGCRYNFRDRHGSRRRLYKRIVI